MRSTYWQIAAVLAIAILVDSCAVTRQPVPVPATAAVQATYPSDLQGAQLFRINPTASIVHILVYRGGTMAHMGHNHVISSTSLSGYLWQHASPEGSGFNIVIPVNELIVDDDHTRAEEGAEFPLNVNEEARQGTRSNMLSEVLLDGEHFPFITIKSIRIGGATNALQVTAALQIKQQTREVTVPVAIEVHGHQLAARGEFDIRQSDFGMVPFSVAMGALNVLDTVKIRFDLVASHIEP
ncbi:MAG TPA: YceI family protein [Halioglobus sp.]